MIKRLFVILIKKCKLEIEISLLSMANALFNWDKNWKYQPQLIFNDIN